MIKKRGKHRLCTPILKSILVQNTLAIMQFERAFSVKFEVLLGCVSGNRDEPLQSLLHLSFDLRDSKLKEKHLKVIIDTRSCKTPS